MTLASFFAMLAALITRWGLFFGMWGGGIGIEWAFAGGTLYLLQCRAMTRNR